MVKKRQNCSFFAAGLPDPTLGGSGIVNYYFCKKLLKENFSVKAFFLCSEKYRKNSVNNHYINELISQGIIIKYINTEKRKKFTFGFFHLANVLNYNACAKFLSENKNNLLVGIFLMHLIHLYQC